MGLVRCPASAAEGLSRIDGAGFSHELLDHLQALTTTRRRVRWVTGWAICEDDEQDIALIPEKAWSAAVRQDGAVHELWAPTASGLSYQVAELTGVSRRRGCPTAIYTARPDTARDKTDRQPPPIRTSPHRRIEVNEHHAGLCRLHLQHIDQLDGMIAEIDTQIEAIMSQADADAPPVPGTATFIRSRCWWSAPG